MTCFILMLVAFAAVPVKHHVSLAWSVAPGGKPTGYNVYRSKIKGGPYSRIGASPTTRNTFYNDYPLNAASGQAYYYVLRAVNPKGLSKPTAEVSATIP
jgi:hypothetical protein